MTTEKYVIVPLSGAAMTVSVAKKTIAEIGEFVYGFKLHATKALRFFAEGYDVFADCKNKGVALFVDIKGYDIPSEVADMVRDLEELGADIITLHASGGNKMLTEAVSERKRAKLLAITILTSMSEYTVGCAYNADSEHLIKRFAEYAFRTGLDGTVSSAADLRLFDESPRKYGNDAMLRVTPGVRFADKEVKGDDQGRVLTPGRAILAGADLLVIGRPILKADVPREAIQRANTEVNDARAELKH